MKNIKQLWTQVVLYAKATKKAWDDLIKMLQVASIIITTSTAFYYGYITDFSTDWFRPVICGTSALFAGTMVEVWLKNYKERVIKEQK